VTTFTRKLLLYTVGKGLTEQGDANFSVTRFISAFTKDKNVVS